MTDFESQRAANIKRNRELLASMGLDAPMVFEKPSVKVKNPPAKSKKRKAVAPSGGLEQPPAKTSKVTVDSGVIDTDAPTPTRRSSRNVGKPKVGYNEQQSQAFDATFMKIRTPQIVTSVVGIDSQRGVGNRLGKRTHNPKTFGAIPGVRVGTWWESRAECSTAAIHAPFVAGIAGSATDGAYSVALSGGYDDDVDLGYAFTYTGSGGRDLKGTKTNPKNLRTAPQSCDQTFDNPMNAALKVSAETQKPVRVIRGFKLQSPYAPKSGYRYDGLYTVEKAWLERGLNKQGYKVCKYAFKRVGGQPPLPTRATPEGDNASEDGRPSSPETEEEDVAVNPGENERGGEGSGADGEYEGSEASEEGNDLLDS